MIIYVALGLYRWEWLSNHGEMMWGEGWNRRDVCVNVVSGEKGKGLGWVGLGLSKDIWGEDR